MNLALTPRTKVLAVAVVIAGAGAAAWFLYLEEWLAGPPAAPSASKPAATLAKAPATAPAPKPGAPEAPKPAAEEAPKPAVAETPKPAPAPEPAKPVAKEEPAKEAPKPMAKKPPVKPAARELAREAAMGSAPATAEAPKVAEGPKAAEAPQTAEAPRKAPPPAIVPMQLVAGPTIPGPRFNDLVTAVLYRDAKTIDDLLAFGRWVDKGDSRGMTPLMLAAMLGDAPITETLLKAGADPNRPGPGGDTAMSIAREQKDSGMLGLLRRHGGR